MRWLRDRYGYRVSSSIRRTAFAVSGGRSARFAGGGPDVTMTTTAAVTAGRLVEVSGNRSIRHAQAASRKVVGVAKQTGSAVGDKVACSPNGVWKLTAQGAIAAGDELIVSAGNDGRVATLAAAAAATLADINNARAIVGIALEAIADGAEGLCLLRKLA